MSAAASLPTNWRERLFGSPTITVVTLLLAALIAWIAVPIIRWALIDATWSGQTRNDCTGSGACWVFIKARFGQFMYGFYPIEERWRPNLAGLSFALAGAAIVFAPKRLKLRLGLAALVILPPLGIWLLGGGFGLRAIETREWGGLMLTVFISIYASLIAIPRNLMPAAAALGARPWQAFRHVLLPLAMPGLLSGSLLVFMVALGYYITPALTGGAGDQMISSVIAFYATGTANWGMAGALGIFLLVPTTVLYLVYGRLSRTPMVQT